MTRPRFWRALLSPVLIVMMLVPVLLTQFPTEAIGQAGAQVIEGNSASIGAGELLSPSFSASPQAPTAAQIAASEAQMERAADAMAARTLPIASGPVAAPVAGTETRPDSRAQAPGTFTLFRNVAVNGAPAGFKSNVNEPSISQSGKFAWLTHNWYAARSINGGVTWAYVSPFTDMADFCCDQDTVYDRGRDIFIWYRQGIYNVAPAPAGQNRIKIGVSTNGGATWCTYTFSPVNVNGTWTGQWFDYPHLALSNNYLYFTSNMFSGAGAFLRMFMARWPLDSMAACAGFSYTYWWKTTGWSWTPVQGATTTMYVGDHNNTANMYIGVQPESTTTLTANSRAIPAWTFTNRFDAVCTVLGGANPCSRSDQRILVGWVRPLMPGGVGQVGFFWNVQEGGGFPKPYVNAATFRQDTLAYTGRPYWWNSGAAWFYAAASPNDRGDLGVSIFYFASTIYPRWYLGIDDDYNAAPPGWENAFAASSTGAVMGASGANWGDYVRVRQFNPPGTSWVATGFTSTGSSNNTVPRAAWFGRGRDQRSFNYWNNK